MGAQHTPGPWAAWRAPGGEWVVRARFINEAGQRVTTWPAVCNCGATQNEANARLIAAAPDLLRALRVMVHHHKASPHIGLARAAIAAAEGRA